MNKTEIIKWLSEYNINNYVINDDLSVDVVGNVNLVNRQLKSIPVKFNTVNGDFYCSYNKLTSLEHCPHTVNGHFSCYNNKLTSLEHCPHIVNGDFYCDEHLKSTKHYQIYLMIQKLRK